MLVQARFRQVNMDIMTSRQCNSGIFRPFQGRGASTSRPAPFQRRTLLTRAADKKQDSSPVAEKAGGVVQKVQQALDEIDDNILAYCNLDKKTGGKRLKRMTLGEKEQEFLSAMSSYYFGEKPDLSNEEFDNLREELIWEGSQVAVLSGTEQRFLEASLASTAGKPIMSDEEYDELKAKLRNKNSKVVSQGPRCSIRSKNLYSDATPDYLKMVGLNVPAAVLTLAALFSVDDITGFQITNLLELPEPYGIIFLWGFVFPAVFIFVASLTNFVFKDNLILKGNCPNCNATTSTYFGDILTVKGNREKNEVQCGDCGAKLQFNSLKREIKVEAFPGEGKKKGAAGAKKKGAAASAKKKSAEAGSKKQGSESGSGDKKESPKPQAA